MCSTFAILSPDLFTYVYSRIPPEREREFIQKRGLLLRVGREEKGRARVGKVVAWVVGWSVGVRQIRRVDSVSHESEATEGSLCSIFKILYDLLRCSSGRLCSAGERSRKRQRERAIFPSRVPPARPLSFFTKSRKVHATAAAGEAACIRIRWTFVRLSSVFIILRLITRARAHAPAYTP